MAGHKRFHFITIFLALLTILRPSEQTTVGSRKLDQSPSDDIGNKCGGCPCNNPCNQPASPPPPPPSPSPPPPSLPPPPPKNPSPSNNCPPPPAGGGGGGGGQYYPPNPPYMPNPPYIFINGPPGDLYPVDNYSSGSGRSFSTGGSVLRILIAGFLGLVAFC